MATVGEVMTEKPQNFQRTPATPIAQIPGKLPLAKIDEDTDITSIAEAYIPKLAALDAEKLTSDAVWRDCLALTGTFRTFYSANSVLKAWKTTCASHGSSKFSMIPSTARLIRVGPETAWVDAAFTFKNFDTQPQQMCSGFISLIPGSDGKWKVWMLRTILEQVEGWGNVDVLASTQTADLPNGTPEATTNGTIDGGAKHFGCIVVGGGQAGLGVGGRLQALQISYLIVDKHPAVGDSWNARYDSTKCMRAINMCL